MAPGLKDVRVSVPLTGNSDSSALTYQLQLTSLSVNQGSMAGGVPVKITGVGFTSDTSLIDVTIGKFGCKVVSASTTEIECTTGPSANVVPIDNSGSDSSEFFFSFPEKHFYSGLKKHAAYFDSLGLSKCLYNFFYL